MLLMACWSSWLGKMGGSSRSGDGMAPDVARNLAVVRPRRGRCDVSSGRGPRSGRRSRRSCRRRCRRSGSTGSAWARSRGLAVLDDRACVGLPGLVQGHDLGRDRYAAVLDRTETTSGGVVAAAGGLVIDRDAEQAGDAVDLGALFGVRAANVYQEIGAQCRDREGRVGVE